MKHMEKVETSGNAVGNTKINRVVPSKYWCFTWNNYPEGSMETLETLFWDLDILYIIGFEVGENGTPHLQGYIEAKNKIRPIEKFGLDKSIHWEKRKTDRNKNIKYCSKELNFKTNFKMPEKIKTIEFEKMYDWQKSIIELIKMEPDDRSIYWYWDKEGAIGKSCLCKYLCVNESAILLSGKAADMKYAVQQYVERNKKGPKVILIDIPRESMKFISYAGIEELKNGMFFSGKYEGSMVLYNSPHIVCMANSPPITTTMSEDRWKITNLGVSGGHGDCCSDWFDNKADDILDKWGFLGDSSSDDM